MQHKKIGLMLNAAGAMATLGILFIFYVPIPAALVLGLMKPHMLPPIVFMAAAGVPYLLALGCYFRVCGNISRDRSFCMQNVQLMNRIARLLFVEALLWLLALAALLVFGVPGAVLLSPATCCILAVLFVLANAAVALVARMMALLVNRAVALQEDSDLTI